MALKVPYYCFWYTLVLGLFGLYDYEAYTIACVVESASCTDLQLHLMDKGHRRFVTVGSP